MMKIKTKTIVLILCCFWLGIHEISAQNITSGVRAGFGINTLIGEDITEGESLVGFNGGLFLNYSIGDVFSIQPELNLSIKGANNVNINTFPFTKAVISYIQVPVMFQVTTRDIFDGKVLPYLELGPAINAHIVKDLEGQILEGIPGAFSVDQNVRRFHYELLGGLGAKINRSYILNVRYARGLSNVFEQGDVKTSTVLLSVGYMF